MTTLYGTAAAGGWDRNYKIKKNIVAELVLGTWRLDKDLMKDETLQKAFVSEFRKSVNPPDSLYVGSEFITEDFSDLSSFC